MEQKNFPFVLFYSSSFLFIYYMCKISHQKNIFETHCTCVNITSVRFISQVIFIQKGSCQEVSYIFTNVIPFSKSLLFSRVLHHPTVSIFKYFFQKIGKHTSQTLWNTMLPRIFYIVILILLLYYPHLLSATPFGSGKKQP